MRYILILALVLVCFSCEAEDINWGDLEGWIKYDDTLRQKLAFDIIKNGKSIDLDWFLEYEEELNEKCAEYIIPCECGQDFYTIPDKRTWKEYTMLESWITTCPHCKDKYNAWYDNDFPVMGIQSYGFGYKEKEAFCDNKDCKWRYINHSHY